MRSIGRSAGMLGLIIVAALLALGSPTAAETGSVEGVSVIVQGRDLAAATIAWRSNLSYRNVVLASEGYHRTRGSRRGRAAVASA